MRRIILVVMIVSLFLVSIPMWSEGAKEKKVVTTTEKKVIHFLGQGSDEWGGRFDRMVEIFNRENREYVISFERVAPSSLHHGWEALNQKFFAGIAAGDPPDVLLGGVALLTQFAAEGLIQPLNRYIDTKIKKADFIPDIFYKLKQPDGNVYAIPTGVLVMGLYYNKDMFDAAGLPYPSPKFDEAMSMETFKSYVEKLASGSGANKKFGFYATFDPERNGPLVFSSGGDFFNADLTKCTLDSPQVKRLYTMLQGFINEGYSPSPGQVKAMPWEQMFMSGRIGLLCEGPWMNPSFMVAAEKGNLRYGVCPVPKGEGGSMSVIYLDSYCIPTGSKQPDGAFDAIMTFIGPEAGKINIETNIDMPLNLSLQKQARNEMWKYLSPAEKNVFFDGTAHAKTFPFNSTWNECRDAIMKTADLLAINDISVSDGCDKMARDVNAIIAAKKK